MLFGVEGAGVPFTRCRIMHKNQGVSIYRGLPPTGKPVGFRPRKVWRFFMTRKRDIKVFIIPWILIVSSLFPGQVWAGQLTHPQRAINTALEGVSVQTQDLPEQTLGNYTEDTIFSLIKYKDVSQQGQYEKARRQIAKAIADKVPDNLVSYFFEHHGVIYIGLWEDNGGYTEFAVEEDNKPMMPDSVFEDYPCNMYISVADSDYRFLDDYVIHEFGHVLDAKFRITKDPAYNNTIASETAAVVTANQTTSVDAEHYSSTPETFAQVCAAYWDGADAVGSQATVAAAPGTLEIIKKFENR